MSLIQEALKRQQQEADSQHESTVAPPTTPTTQPEPEVAAPPPPPPPVSDEITQPNLDKPADTPKPPKKSMSLVNHAPTAPPVHAIEPEKVDTKKKSGGSPWQKLIIVLIILFIIIAAAGVMIFFAMKKLAGGQLEKIVDEYTEEIENIVYEEPESVEVKPKTEKIPKNIIKNSPKKAPVQIKEPVIVRAPVKWPQLKITAALAKGGVGQAIINGEFITVGETINGVKLVEINGNTVKFSYKNEMKLLKVGN